MTYPEGTVIWIISIRIRQEADRLQARAVAGCAKEGERFQFVRMGYYCKDRESGRFNRIVTLKDSFAKTLKK